MIELREPESGWTSFREWMRWERLEGICNRVMADVGECIVLVG